MAEFQINIDLPDHTEKLEKAEEYIKEQQNKFKLHLSNKEITEEIYVGLSDYFRFHRLYEQGEFSILTYSPIPYLLGLLFIILGVIKIREVIVDEK